MSSIQREPKFERKSFLAVCENEFFDESVKKKKNQKQTYGSRNAHDLAAPQPRAVSPTAPAGLAGDRERGLDA